jgi:predicted Zn-dependent protease
MIRKALIELAALVVAFFGIWYGLSRIDWHTLLKVKEINKSTEQQLGEYTWAYLEASEKEITAPGVVDPVDSIVTHLCSKNGLDRSSVRVHVIEKNDVNAFAFPGGHLVVYSGLIRSAENEAELAGVIGHEIAHIQKAHVMKKLVKELGLSALISVTSGSTGGEVSRRVVKHLTSSAYDRTLEQEADLVAVDYMAGAGVDPKPFSDFLYRMALEEGQLMKDLSWLNTHPDSEERAKTVLEHANRRHVKSRKILSETTWNRLRELTSPE